MTMILLYMYNTCCCCMNTTILPQLLCCCTIDCCTIYTEYECTYYYIHAVIHAYIHSKYSGSFSRRDGDGHVQQLNIRRYVTHVRNDDACDICIIYIYHMYEIQLRYL